jgi:hypothetical protein
MNEKKIREVVLGDPVSPVGWFDQHLSVKVIDPKLRLPRTIELSSEETKKVLAVMSLFIESKVLDNIFDNLLPYHESESDQTTSLTKDLEAVDEILQKHLYPIFTSYSCEQIEESIGRCLIERYGVEFLMNFKDQISPRFNWFVDYIHDAQKYEQMICERT